MTFQEEDVLPASGSRSMQSLTDWIPEEEENEFEMPERALVSLHRRTRGPKNEVFKITCLEAGARRDDEQTVGRETIANTGATAVMTTDQHSTFLQ